MSEEEEEEEGAAVRKSRPPDRRLRAATAGVTGVSVARELAEPREEEEGKKTIVTFFPLLKKKNSEAKRASVAGRFNVLGKSLRRHIYSRK